MQTDAYLFCCKLVRLQYNAICVIWYCVTLNEINCSEEFTYLPSYYNRLQEIITRLIKNFL